MSFDCSKENVIKTEMINVQFTLDPLSLRSLKYRIRTTGRLFRSVGATRRVSENCISLGMLWLERKKLPIENVPVRRKHAEQDEISVCSRYQLD